MFRSTSSSVDSALAGFNSQLNQFTEKVRNHVLRGAVAAAGVPVQQCFAAYLANHVGPEPTTRTIRGTGIKVARPHYKDAIITKVWRIPTGNGFINYIGPMTVEIPHAHWFEIGPKDRYTKDGKYRGSMPDYHILSRVYQASEPAAIDAFGSELTTRISQVDI